MAKLLANGMQYFTDNNGEPLAGGKVYMYIPSTTTLKDTWQDAGETILNTNPIILDAAGRAVIYGTGEYRQFLTDALDNEIWDQLTSTFDPTGGGGVLWGGISAGSANAQTVTTLGTATLVGQIVVFLAGFTNTTDATLTVDAFVPYFMVKDTDQGPSPLTGGEIVQGNLVCCVFDEDNQVFHLVEYALNDLRLITLALNRLTFRNDITPTALAVDTNNWSPTGLSTTSHVRMSSSAVVSVTGLLAQTGRMIFLDNIGAFAITFKVNDVASSAGNRFLGSDDFVIRAGQSVIMLYDTSSAGWRLYVLNPTSVLPPLGLYIRNGGTPDKEVTLTATRQYVVDNNGVAQQLSAVNVTGDITTLGANGLDVGAVATNTGYFIWLIYNISTNTPALLFSLSSTAPTMPAGYTYKVRLGWTRTNGSSDLYGIMQKGSVAKYVVSATQAPPTIASGSAGNPVFPGWVAFTIIGLIPSTAPIITLALHSGDDSRTGCAPNNSYNGSSTNTRISSQSQDNTGQQFDMLLESTNVYYASQGGLGGLECVGWIDDIG